MVTMIKRIYENSNIEDHREAGISKLSHRRYSTIEDHLEAVISGLSYVGYSTIENHPESEINRLFLEGNLCVFCFSRDEKSMEDRFVELVAEWRRGTGGLSSPMAIASHPAYQQIIKMGETALPMIFQELRENGGWWYPALRALTGRNPVPEAAKGRPPLNREAWLEWGRRDGYLQP